MSLREKAREVKAAGEAERGNFTPTGAPLRVYKYWASRSKNAPERENFCHFWRVVVFWAPFMAFRRTVAGAAEAVFTNPYALGVMGIGLVVALILAGITWGEFGGVMLFALGFVYAAAGIVLGGVYATEKYRHDSWQPVLFGNGETNTYYKRPEIDQVARIGAFITFPFSWITFALFSVSSRMDKDTKEAIGGFLALAMLAVFVVFMLVAGITTLGWWLPVVIVATLAAIALFVGIALSVGRLAQALRAYSKKKSDESYEAWVAEGCPVPEKRAKREPGKVSKFFTAIADFLILAVQVVRVNKWKICPIVTVDEK